MTEAMMANTRALQIVKQTAREIIELSSKSAILADQKSKAFCHLYSELEVQQQPPGGSSSGGASQHHQLLRELSKDHGLKAVEIYNTVNAMTSISKSALEFEQNFKQSHFERLKKNLRPEYSVLFQNLGRVGNGVRTLVKMRQDLLGLLEEKKDVSGSEEVERLKIMNSVLKDLLSLWFSTGLLNIQKITWNSPASLVEKVAHYESVHHIRSLSDLKNRLGSSRRCFIYTHSTMPYEPLVILHIALTHSVSSSIKDLISTTRQKGENDEISNKTSCSNAIFYSINSCQKGLQQVDLGNALIKSCVQLLLNDDQLPNLRHFHTLSPIPKFRDWLDSKMKMFILNNNSSTSSSGEFFQIEKCLTDQDRLFLVEHFQSDESKVLLEKIRDCLVSKRLRDEMPSMLLDNSGQTSRLYVVIREFLMRACAFYLVNEKKNGYAFNSVANFHLKNGAKIYRLNFAADMSENGWKSSYGLMVNYGYELSDLDTNCVNYLINKHINISDQLSDNLKTFETTK